MTIALPNKHHTFPKRQGRRVWQGVDCCGPIKPRTVASPVIHGRWHDHHVDLFRPRRDRPSPQHHWCEWLVLRVEGGVEGGGLKEVEGKKTWRVEGVEGGGCRVEGTGW